ncbi:hypothetical protein BT63DRAFT_475797 [Microthyrium microscopicum]|uniref:Uncharacterized protein n=1 Tax=Microthyrium microscopicum TaxID=703497 RepID=A0A6A6UQ94_9PEZI|nr:hypothetical protein BT63DRAFT_475797 [Microthyrium microscopicum]
MASMARYDVPESFLLTDLGQQYALNREMENFNLVVRKSDNGFPFLRVPLELRRMVYNFTLPESLNALKVTSHSVRGEVAEFIAFEKYHWLVLKYAQFELNTKGGRPDLGRGLIRIMRLGRRQDPTDNHCTNFNNVFDPSAVPFGVPFPFDINMAQNIRKIIFDISEYVIPTTECQCETYNFCLHDLQFMFPNLKHVVFRSLPGYYIRSCHFFHFTINWTAGLDNSIMTIDKFIMSIHESWESMNQYLNANTAELPPSSALSQISSVSTAS